MMTENYERLSGESLKNSTFMDAVTVVADTAKTSRSIIGDFGDIFGVVSIIISFFLLLATIFGVIVAFWSSTTARKNYETAKLAILTALADDWLKLQENWVVAQLIVRGLDDYYSPSIGDEVDRISAAHEKYQADPFGVNRPLNKIRAEIELLVQYFDRLSLKILEGSLSPAEAYSVLGPNVARHSRVVRWTVGAAEATPELPGLESEDPDYGWVDYPASREIRGRRSRIIYLTDALWSELVQKRDLEPHQIGDVALHKFRTGSGQDAQKRAFELARSFGGRKRARRLSHQLTFAEYLPTSLFSDFGAKDFSELDELTNDSYLQIRGAGRRRSLAKRILLARFWFVKP